MTVIHAIRNVTNQSKEATETAADDFTLVQNTLGGDLAAFELIMRRNNRRLYRLVRSIVKSGADAEDALQETYIRAYQKLDQFRGPDGFSAWLGRIAINEALGRLRRRGREISLDDYLQDSGTRAVDNMKSQQPSPERLAANSELRGRLEAAIDQLPDAFRTVFVLRAVEGMSIAETAHCLAIRPQTVKTRHHRARRLLQDELGRQFEAFMPTTFDFGGEHCDRIVARVFDRLAALEKD